MKLPETETILKGLKPIHILLGPRAISHGCGFRASLLMIVIFVVGILATAVDHSLYFPGNQLGFLEDAPNYLQYLAFAIALTVIPKLAKRYLVAFVGGVGQWDIESGLLPAVKFDEDFRKRYDEHVESKLNWVFLRGTTPKLWYWGLHLFIVVFYGWFAIWVPINEHRAAAQSWNFGYVPFGDSHAFMFGYLYNQAKDILMWVLIMPSVAWLTATIALTTKQIVKFLAGEDRFVVVPLAPDNVGGLAPLGQVSLMLFVVVMVLIIPVLPVPLIWGFNLGYQIIFPVIFIFAAFVFFYPLSGARATMMTAKESESRLMAMYVRQCYDRFEAAAHNSNESPQHEARLLADLVNARQLYKDTQQMPVWPYDFRTLLQFLSIFIIPVIVFVVQLVVNSDSILYNQSKLAELLTWVVERIASSIGF